MNNIYEYVSKEEGISFDEAKAFIKGLYDEFIKNPKHKGDCTKESQPCNTCVLHSIMEDYAEYLDKQIKWQ